MQPPQSSSLARGARVLTDLFWETDLSTGPLLSVLTSEDGANAFDERNRRCISSLVLGIFRDGKKMLSSTCKPNSSIRSEPSFDFDFVFCVLPRSSSLSLANQKNPDPCVGRHSVPCCRHSAGTLPWAHPERAGPTDCPPRPRVLPALSRSSVTYLPLVLPPPSRTVGCGRHAPRLLLRARSTRVPLA